MLQRPSEQERVELLAIAGARRSPAQPGRARAPGDHAGCDLPSPHRRPARARPRPRAPTDGQADRPRVKTAGQVIRYPAQPRQRRELNCGAEPVLDTDVGAKPSKVVTSQREERDQVVVGDLVRPATQAREFGVGKKSNRHTARYPRRSMPDKTGGAHRRSPPVRGSPCGRRMAGAAISRGSDSYRSLPA